MITLNGEKVREVRCPKCHAFVTYERIFAGIIVHKCSKCGETTTYTYKFFDVPSVRAIIESLFVMEKRKGGE